MKIPVSNPYITEKEASSIYEVVKSGWISMGKGVDQFERNFSEYVGCEKSVAVNNGTSALHLAVIMSGITEEDEVLIPDITFFSTASAVMYEKATPILVECDPSTLNISLEDAERKITKKTKAIIPVDMNGLSIDYDSITEFAKKHKLKVIADSAEALGGEYKGNKVGSQSPIHIFSFFPNKNITTGEGGMITLNGDGVKYYEKLKELRSMGQSERYHHVSLGFNYRMNDIAATLGIEQLKKVNYIIDRKKEIVKRYNASFVKNSLIKTPHIPDYATQHSWYMYMITLDESINRDDVVNFLAEEGIETRCSFPPMHIQPAIIEYMKDRRGSLALDETFSAWQKIINLPIWSELSSSDQDFVIDKVNQIVRV